MRYDIKWLLCERQRIGSRKRSLKTGARLNPNIQYSDDFDSGPSRVSSARLKQGDHKILNENLSPLYRFLDNSVGRLWDDVYSEIRQQVDYRRANGFHVLQHVAVYVDSNGSHGNSWRRHYLYADPDTGILCKTERKRYVRPPEPVTSVHWHHNFWFNRETFRRTICGCDFGDFAPKAEGKCQHHNVLVSYNVWYVVEHGWHGPDEILTDYIDSYGERHTVYYRDVPHKMKEPFVISKQVANRKHLKIIRRALGVI